MTPNLGHPIPFTQEDHMICPILGLVVEKACLPQALPVCPRNRAQTKLKAGVVMNHYFEGKVNVRFKMSGGQS